MTQHNGEDYLSAEESASRLGVSRRTVERYAETGKIKKYRKGTRVLFKKTEIESLLEHLNVIEEVDGQKKE